MPSMTHIFPSSNCSHKCSRFLDMLVFSAVAVVRGYSIPFSNCNCRYTWYYVNNYSSLKRGVYRPDSTYKTAEMLSKNIHTKLKWKVVVWKGKITRWPVYQRLIYVCIAICKHLIERSNWSVLNDLMLFVYIVERINQTFTWICSQFHELHSIHYMEHTKATIIST